MKVNGIRTISVYISKLEIKTNRQTVTYQYLSAFFCCYCCCSTHVNNDNMVRMCVRLSRFRIFLILSVLSNGDSSKKKKDSKKIILQA